MYHIKQDRRSRASADEIARGLNTCLKTMPLSAVTITDLHRATGVSRATFYRLFDNIEDVLVYQCDQMLESMRDSYAENGINRPYDAVRHMILMSFDYLDFLDPMVNNRCFDLLYEYTARRIFGIESLRRAFANGLNEVETEYVIANLAMSMVATLTTWIRRGRKESAQELFQYNTQYWDALSRLMKE